MILSKTKRKRKEAWKRRGSAKDKFKKRNIHTIQALASMGILAKKVSKEIVMKVTKTIITMNRKTNTRVLE